MKKIERVAQVKDNKVYVLLYDCNDGHQIFCAVFAPFFNGAKFTDYSFDYTTNVPTPVIFTKFLNPDEYLSYLNSRLGQSSSFCLMELDNEEEIEKLRMGLELKK